jgi:hypothetical protein
VTTRACAISIVPEPVIVPDIKSASLLLTCTPSIGPATIVPLLTIGPPMVPIPKTLPPLSTVSPVVFSVAVDTVSEPSTVRLLQL